MDIFDLAARISLDSSEYEKGVENASGKASDFGSAWGNAAKIAGVAFTAIATGVGVITEKSIKAYANYEQLVGGVETLFKVSSDKVQQYADIAYKTAGLSANEYMETVTGFSASLLQSLGGNTEKAADVADRAIRDMSDNANKMGSDIESIKTAYAGFSKQNYTMLDNLKLGYGGTKEEMERLIKDAAKMTEEMDKLGISVDADSMSFGNIVNAISIMQEHLDIAGTTAKEAATTISGSISSAKSSWTNLITGMANENADFDRLVNEFVESVGVAADNLIPRIEIAINGIGNLVTGLAPKIAEKLPELVQNILPSLLNAAVDTTEALLRGVVSTLPSLSSNIVDILLKIADIMSNNSAEFATAAVTIVATLIDGMTDAIPDLIPSIITIITEISNALVDNAPLLMDAAFNLVIALATGIIDNIPEIISAVFELCGNIISTLAGFNWTDKAAEIFTAVGNALTDAFSVALGVIDGIFGTHLSQWYNDCKTLFYNIGVEIGKIGQVDLTAPLREEAFEVKTAVYKEIRRLVENGMEATKALEMAEKIVSGKFSEETYSNYRYWDRATADDAKDIANAIISQAEEEADRVSGYYTDMQKRHADNIAAAEKDAAKMEVSALEESTETNVKTVKKSTEKKLTAWEKAVQSLDKMYKTHQISEGEYWQAKEIALEKYADKDSESWWAAMDAVTKHYNDLAEAEKKAAEKAAKETAETIKKYAENVRKNFSDYLNGITSVADEYKKRIDDLSKTISSYSSNLSGGLASGFKKDENGKIVNYSGFADKKSKLTKYFQLLKDLKKSGISGMFMSMFQGVSLDEGLELAQYLKGLSSSSLDNITNSWNDITNTATQISELLYSDQAQSIADEMKTALEKAVGDGEFSNIGERIVDGITEGMTGEASVSKMQKSLNQLGNNVKDVDFAFDAALFFSENEAIRSGNVTIVQNFMSPVDETRDTIQRNAKMGVELAASK